MTDNDNKDPQITAEIVQEWLDINSEVTLGIIDKPETYALAQAYLKQSAELEQLRADNEISESTQAALYKSLLIIQRKYEQLRAERQWQDISTAPKDGTKILAYLIDNAEHRKSFPENERNGIDIIVWTNHNKGGWISNRFGTPTLWMPLLDKLTDSAQSGEGKQCD